MNKARRLSVSVMVVLISACSAQSDVAGVMTTQAAQTTVPTHRTYAEFGQLHNRFMNTALSSLSVNARRGGAWTEACNSFRSALVEATRTLDPKVRRRVLEATYTKTPRNFGMATQTQRLISQTNKLASMFGQAPVAPSMMASSEEPCVEDCGGGGDDPDGPTYEMSTAAYVKIDQIYAAIDSATSPTDYSTRLTGIVGSGVTALPEVEQAAVLATASVAEASFANAVASFEDESESGPCTEAQKKQKAKTVAKDDATAFVGVYAGAIGVALAGGPQAWAAVFVGAAVSAGAVSATSLMFEASTPCS